MVEVKVTVSGGKGLVVEYEVSGGESGEMYQEKKTFRIGVVGSMVCFLTMKRRMDCRVTLEVDGDVDIELDGKKSSSLKKGQSRDISTSAKRIFVKERVK